MDAPKVSGSKVAITIGVIFAALILFTLINKPGGPIAETTGTIQSYGFEPSVLGPARQVATVRLGDGNLVQAEVLSGVLVQPNRVARVLAYRRIFSGARYYQVVGMEPKK